MDILQQFSCKSGHKVKTLKSKVVFSSNGHHDTIDRFARAVDIKVSKSFGKYLRFRFFHKRPTNMDF